MVYNIVVYDCYKVWKRNIKRKDTIETIFAHPIVTLSIEYYQVHNIKYALTRRGGGVTQYSFRGFQLGLFKTHLFQTKDFFFLKQMVRAI